MCKLIPALVLGLAVVVAPVQAEYYGQDEAVAIAKSWYRNYLHRKSETSGLTGCVNNLRAGVDPDYLLSLFLGGDEYYARVGSTRLGLLRGLFRDVLGRRPTSREARSWAGRLESQTNQEMIYDFLQRYPRR